MTKYVPAITLKEYVNDGFLPRLAVGIKKKEFIAFLDAQPGDWVDFYIVKNREPRGSRGYTHCAKLKDEE